jgi:hypothetical protein
LAAVVFAIAVIFGVIYFVKYWRQRKLLLEEKNDQKILKEIIDSEKNSLPNAGEGAQ